MILRRQRYQRVLSFLMLFGATPTCVFCQETPAFETNAFDTSQSFRQNVCAQQARFHNGTVLLRDALQGIAVRPLVTDGEVMRDPETGRINADYPGIIGVLLDELARRGGFTWRKSYGVATGGRTNRTFDDLLEWSVDTFDLMAGGWTETLERMNRGIIFPEGWRDGSIILVGIEREQPSELDLLSFLKPFDAGVWIMIGVTIFVSAIVYYGFEHFNPESDFQALTKASESIYMTALIFTQQSDFQPRTDYARLFSWSMTFWALIITSAYTANLASFLVIDNTPALPVKSLGDAVRLGLPLCVWATSADDRIVSTAYPQAKLVRKTYYEEIFDGIRRGECRLAVSSLSDWESHEQLSEVNGDCRLTWIGRVFKFVQTGFATISDSGTLCTSLIRDVINLHLKEMKEDGFLEREWRRHLERSADTDCDIIEADLASDDQHSPRLSLHDMAGLFIFHGSLTAIAVCMFVFSTYFDRKKWRFVKRERQEASEKAKAAAKLDGGVVNGVETASSRVVSDITPTRNDQSATSDEDLLQLRDQMHKWAALLDEKMQQRPPPNDDP